MQKYPTQALAYPATYEYKCVIHRLFGIRSVQSSDARFRALDKMHISQLIHPDWKTGLNGFNGHVQVDFAQMKDFRHFGETVYSTMNMYPLELRGITSGEQIHLKKLSQCV